MFVAYGLSAVFPVFHGLGLYGYEKMKQSIGLNWAVLQGFLYILGAAIYAVSHRYFAISWRDKVKLTMQRSGPCTREVSAGQI